MAIVTRLNNPVAGKMATKVIAQYTALTTATGAYEEIVTLAANNQRVWYAKAAAATNNLLFKIEVSRDGTTYTTIVTDMAVAKGATVYFNFAGNIQTIRYSVNEAVKSSSGTLTLDLVGDEEVYEYLNQFAYEKIAVSTAKSLTAATYLDATQAIITVEDNPIRVRTDGTAPTASEGILLEIGDTLTIDMTHDISLFQAIATGAAASIKVLYYR